jgi:hypothetical protein
MRAMLAALVLLVASACNAPWAPGGLNGLTCIAVPDDTCISYAQSVGLGTDPTVVAVQVECTKLPCTAAGGEAKVLVRRSDGRIDETGFGWQQAGPPPIPVPQPVPVPAESAPPSG